VAPAENRQAEAPAMPAAEPERSAEAIRRALPDLLKLERYEQRARRRRDIAIQGVIVLTICGALRS